MTILATIAMIALIVVGIMVLRMKSDPMEKESVRKLLAKPSTPEAASTSVSAAMSKETGSEETKTSSSPNADL